MIPSEIIELYGSSIKHVAANSFLFYEGESANFYYQIISGRIKMVNVNNDGKEFVQGIAETGQSFGEPPIFHGAPYPASARAMEDTELYKLPKENLFALLKDYPDIHLKLTAVLTKRLMYKAMIMKEISNHDAEHRILTFIDYLKSEYGTSGRSFEVNLTRQQLSTLLGIRVETVIRTIKQLEEKGDVSIVGRKVFR